MRSNSPARGEDVRRAWVEDFGTLDEKLAQSIADLMCGVPLQIATQMIEGLNSWNGVGAMALCGVPTLMIRAGLSDHPDALRLREIKPDLQVGITVGAGDFHQLEVPDQVNAMIDRFLSVNNFG